MLFKNTYDISFVLFIWIFVRNLKIYIIFNKKKSTLLVFPIKVFFLFKLYTVNQIWILLVCLPEVVAGSLQLCCCYGPSYACWVNKLPTLSAFWRQYIPKAQTSHKQDRFTLPINTIHVIYSQQWPRYAISSGFGNQNLTSLITQSGIMSRLCHTGSPCPVLIPNACFFFLDIGDLPRLLYDTALSKTACKFLFSEHCFSYAVDVLLFPPPLFVSLICNTWPT